MVLNDMENLVFITATTINAASLGRNLSWIMSPYAWESDRALFLFGWQWGNTAFKPSKTYINFETMMMYLNINIILVRKIL